MRTLLIQNVYSHLLILIYVINASCTPSMEDQVKTYEDAHNRHDIDKVMSLYSDDITFEIIGAWKKTGIKRI